MDTKAPRAPQSRLQLALLAALAVVLVGLGTPTWKWHAWATVGGSPYDEIGIDVNSYMTKPLHDWACGRIKERFPNSIPPWDCSARGVS